MKSNWIPMKPNTTQQTDRSDLMRKIYELIDWYEDNSTRKEDDFIKAKLKSIIHLAENVENSEDIMFLEFSLTNTRFYGIIATIKTIRR